MPHVGIEPATFAPVAQTLTQLTIQIEWSKIPGGQKFTRAQTKEYFLCLCRCSATPHFTDSKENGGQGQGCQNPKNSKNGKFTK